MAEIIIMPKEGITVETCLIGKWRKGIGDTVSQDDVLFDYETDKAAFECISSAGGVLLHRFYGEGEEVPVLSPVAIVGAEGEDISALIAEASAGTVKTEAEIAVSAEFATENAPEIEAKSEVCESCESNHTEASRSEPQGVSPRARNFAAELGIDLSGVAPTGPSGRIIERDVIAAANAMDADSREAVSQAAEAQPEPAPDKTSEPLPDYTDELFTKTRSEIAKTIMYSLQRSAQLTHQHSFDATSILAAREDFKALDAQLGYGGVSVGDMILFAVSRLLTKYPAINALVAEKGLRKFNTVNLGVAVDTPRGLMVPTIFRAEKKTLKEISNETKALAAACRAGKISPDLLKDGTFTVSNLGATGVEAFTPILNPPQAAILGVCGVTERVRKGENGQLAVYPSIGLSMTYDHRAIDGAPASLFLSELCKALAAFSWKTLALERERGAI